jgi:hypothetical protein
MCSAVDCVGKPHNHLNGSLADVCEYLLQSIAFKKLNLSLQTACTVKLTVDSCTYYIIPSTRHQKSTIVKGSHQNPTIQYFRLIVRH